MTALVLPPTPQEQVRFLENVQRLMGEGSFQATYKYALLHALADLSLVHGDDTGAVLPLKTTLIAERFIELYWPQCKPFPTTQGDAARLRQNKGGPAAVLTAVTDYAARWRSPAALRLSAADWRSLVQRVAKVVANQPLQYLQNVGGDRLDFLYTRVRGGVLLRPGVAYCFRAFHGLLTDMFRGAWLRFVRRRNEQLLGTVKDLHGFMFGSDRQDLSGFRHVLAEVDGDDCFYCRGRLRGPGEVDHFVPWSRWPVDLGHNFVRAHASCNARKSDHLAAEEHLERWVSRNHDYGADLATMFDARGLPHAGPATTRAAGWAYAQLARVGGQTWSAGKRFTPLSGQWQLLLAA